MFKHQLPSKYSLFDAIHLSICFFHCSKQFLNLSIVMPFSVSTIFLFYFFHISKMFPFKDFFHPAKQNHYSRWVGHRDYAGGFFVVVCLFLSKHSACCRLACSKITHDEMGKGVERVFKKMLLKPNTASHNNASWYTDTDGLLEHSSSGGSLYYKGFPFQKIIPVLGGCPLIYKHTPI